MARLELESVSFAYGPRVALRGVSLDLDAGTVLGVIGPNGAGKSTLLKVAAGLERPREGCVRIDGIDSSALRPRQLGRLVGYVPQSLSLPFPFRVTDVVLMGRHPHLGRALFESRADLEVARRVMELTGVVDLADRPFDELSGGERQRVVIAAALAQEPRLLVLDEPTSSLDLRFQASTVRLLRDLVSSGELAVLVALHDLNLGTALCDRIALLVAGEVRALGSPDQVLRQELLEEAYETSLHVGNGPAGTYVLPSP